MMIIISIETWKLTYLCHCWRSLHRHLPLACLEPAEQLKVEKLTAGVELAAGQLLSPATPSQLAENIYFLFMLKHLQRNWGNYGYIHMSWNILQT